MTKGRYADFMGFLLTPHQIMSKEESPKVAPGVGLNFLHCTSVPPVVIKMEDVIAEHKRFCNILHHNQSVGLPELYFGLQNPPEDIILGKDSSLRELTDAGIKFMGLAYELDSSYGAGFANPTGRLTPRGENLLRAMDNLEMVLDLSHAGHQTARDAIEYVINKSLTLKVVATHTACHAVYGHKRNLPDDVLQGIIYLGGVIGLATATFMLHPTNNILEPFFDHLHHLLKVVGPDHVVLGTDGIYRTIDVQESEKLFQMMKEKIDPRGNFQARYPDQPFELNRPDRLAVIEQGMLDHGISPVTIEKVMGENLIGFFSRL